VPDPAAQRERRAARDALLEAAARDIANDELSSLVDEERSLAEQRDDIDHERSAPPTAGAGF
jgi:peptide/nickel transport system ATP-binding protein